MLANRHRSSFSFILNVVQCLSLMNYLMNSIKMQYFFMVLAHRFFCLHFNYIPYSVYYCICVLLCCMYHVLPSGNTHLNRVLLLMGTLQVQCKVKYCLLNYAGLNCAELKTPNNLLSVWMHTRPWQIMLDLCMLRSKVRSPFCCVVKSWTWPALSGVLG